eukprot:7656015-Pyramimonas_sp.AAC.1
MLTLTDLSSPGISCAPCFATSVLPQSPPDHPSIRLSPPLLSPQPFSLISPQPFPYLGPCVSPTWAPSVWWPAADPSALSLRATRVSPACHPCVARVSPA